MSALPAGVTVARRRVVATLTIATAVLFALAVVGVWIQVSLTARRNLDSEFVSVTVQPGMGTRDIVASLSNAGIVGDQSTVLLWLVVTGQGKSLKAGDYEFKSPISPVEALGKIQRGEVATRRVTIPEGYNRYDVAETLAEKTGLGSRDRFLALTGDPTLVRDIDPDAGTLEGFLFPDTYEYTPRTTPEELVAQMVDRFRKVYASMPEFSQVAAQRNMTVHELVTLASMIEEEARVDDERPIISSVFYNRLAKPMRLASDPTFVYAALLAGDYDGNVNNPKHRARNSLYNTYIYEGLPPGPIANPGLKSIEAVLKPESTQFLYFVVSGTEGRHKFSRTVAEHDAAVAEYRRQQREQGTNGQE
ncbi:MAG: endolytic transglycosylase MltG [Acidobacteria bacterium]|nr:endolytic transglycosylase MltG [Acidobacteriota bacterium]